MISEGGRGFYYPTDEMKNLANECNKLYKSPIKIDDNELTRIQDGFVIRDRTGKYLYGISDEGKHFYYTVASDIQSTFRKFLNNIM